LSKREFFFVRCSGCCLSNKDELQKAKVQLNNPQETYVNSSFLSIFHRKINIDNTKSE
jgi:hypothetical protein